jgi:hypothetical protein
MRCPRCDGEHARRKTAIASGAAEYVILYVILYPASNERFALQSSNATSFQSSTLKLWQLAKIL